MTSDLDVLGLLLDEANARQESPEVKYEILRAMASALRGIQDPRVVRNAESIRHSADTLIPLFGGRHAQIAWEVERAKRSWWGRLTAPRTAPGPYVAAHIYSERARGRELIRRAALTFTTES